MRKHPPRLGGGPGERWAQRAANQAGRLEADRRPLHDDAARRQGRGRPTVLSHPACVVLRTARTDPTIFKIEWILSDVLP